MSDHSAQITRMRTSQRTIGKGTAMTRLLTILLGVALAGSALGASLMPPPKLAFLDANGNLLAGGLLYTYAAGTSTPLATYSDQAGTVPNTNPVVLNARGEATIFWGVGPYKVALYTAAGVLIWTQDDLYPPFTSGDVLGAPLMLYSGGSAAAPELTWGDDTNSGFYLIGPDDVGLSVGGTKRWEHTTAGQIETGWAQIAGTMTVAGASTFTGASTFGSTLGVSGAATFDSTLVVSGSATMGPASVSSISVSGIAQFADDATFASSVFVPTPVTSTEAARKDYVDNYVGIITTTDPLEISYGSGLSTHSCAYATVAAKTTVPAGWDCQNATTGMGTEQWSIDEVYVIGTTAQVRWCTNNAGPGVVNPTSRAYRFRCYKPPP